MVFSQSHRVSLRLTFLTFVSIMLQAFQESLSFIDANPSDKRFLLAVSGGIDSVVMVELFRLSGYQYSIAHCNFQLRGKESDEDLKFVKNLANANKVPFYSVCFDIEKFCNENKVSVQMGARQLRYKWLGETREKHKLDYLVTAHHADDAIETFFINLIRGTGISGLHGIKANNGNIIRPLLNLYRKDIEAYAATYNLKWREDSSNESDKYERNKIRHHLLPVLEEINPKVRQSITATIENLGKTEVLVGNVIDKVTQPYVKKEGPSIFIGFEFFKELSPAVEFLYEYIKGMGFNYEQCCQIAEGISRQAGKMFLSDTYCIVIDRDRLIIEPKVESEEGVVFEVRKEDEQLLVGALKYDFKILERTKDFKIPMEPNKAALDYDKLKFPLKIRKWQAGDRFYPLGMNRAKKVSDFLIDNKVSMPDKERVYVLLSGTDIAWVIGYRPDERFKITEGTKNVYLCES